MQPKSSNSTFKQLMGKTPDSCGCYKFSSEEASTLIELVKIVRRFSHGTASMVDPLNTMTDSPVDKLLQCASKLDKYIHIDYVTPYPKTKLNLPNKPTKLADILMHPNDQDSPVRVEVKDSVCGKQVSISITMKMDLMVSDSILESIPDGDPLAFFIKEGKQRMIQDMYRDIVDALLPLKERMEELCMNFPECREFHDICVYCDDVIDWAFNLR